MEEPEITITPTVPQGTYCNLTATYRQIAAVFGGGVIPEAQRDKSMAQWMIDTRHGSVWVHDWKVGTCYRGADGLELGQITRWEVQGHPDAIAQMMEVLTGDHRVRRHIINEAGDEYGPQYVAALERARVHNGIERMIDAVTAYRLASRCWMAEDEARSAITELIDDLTEMRDTITDTRDVAPDKDSKWWDLRASAGDMDRLVIAMRQLSDARNEARSHR